MVGNILYDIKNIFRTVLGRGSAVVIGRQCRGIDEQGRRRKTCSQ